MYERLTTNMIVNGKEKTESFSSTVINKTVMSTLTVGILHSNGSPSLSNQTEKGNKRHLNRQKFKLTLLADDMILYVLKLEDGRKGKE